MSAPDLSTPEARRAYRAELWRVARGWRWSGLAIVVLGAIGYVTAANQDQPLLGSRLGLATVVALVIGWALVITGTVKRTRYHKARMAGWPGNG